MDIRKILFGGALALVLVLFLGYSQTTFYPGPKYTDFCPEQQQLPLLANESACLAVGGQWNPQPCAPMEQKCVPGYCDADFTCRNQFEAADEQHGKNAFFFLLVAGIVTFLLGLAFSKVAVVGAGIMTGSIFTLIYGSVRDWSAIGEIWRLIVLGAALIILIAVGYKIFKR